MWWIALKPLEGQPEGLREASAHALSLCAQGRARHSSEVLQATRWAAEIAAAQNAWASPWGQAWVLRALSLTPRVAQQEEALLLEVSGCERLWGGRERLTRRLLAPLRGHAPVPQAASASNPWLALARLRVGSGAAHAQPANLPLAALSAARPLLPLLRRLGCRSWGDVLALPRSGLAQRLSPSFLHALDAACASEPVPQDLVWPWLSAPEVFMQRVELPQEARSAPELLWAAQRLLGSLREWLLARQLGVLAVELRWAHAWRHTDGVALPPEGALTVRTAEPLQAMPHLRRLLEEQLARTPMQAPARDLCLRALNTASFTPRSGGLWQPPEAARMPLHELIERLSARLGESRVCMPQLLASHTPERMQRWISAIQAMPSAQSAPPSTPGTTRTRPRSASVAAPGEGDMLQEATSASADALSSNALADRRAAAEQRRAERAAPPDRLLKHAALMPPWLIHPPKPLPTQTDGRPVLGGSPLRLLTRAWRVESDWWAAGADEKARDAATSEKAPNATLRDYFIAYSAHAGLLWIYREPAASGDAPERWFWQGRCA